MEKIYDKIFPTFKSDKDIQINNLCKELSWTEPKNYIDDNKNYIFDSFLPEVISNFLKVEKEKSPRIKLTYVKKVFICVSQVQDFNGADGSKAGADDIANILPYAFIKSILNMAYTNLQYLQFFVKKGSLEDQWLTQLNVACGFVLNANYKNLKVTQEEFEENCEKAFNDFTNNDDLYEYTHSF